MTRLLSVVIICLLGTGCGGEGGCINGVTQPDCNEEAPPQAADVSPGGIWVGTLGTGQEVLGLITESGEFHLLTDDGTQYFGAVTMNGNNASAQFAGYTATNSFFEDGSTRGAGSLEGVIQERSTITASLTFQTANGGSNPNTITLTYDARYDEDSSLATLAGNFRDVSTGVILSIDSNGQAFAQNAANSCVLNGTVSIIDAQFNTYRVRYTYSSCEGANAILNDVPFNGLATLDNSASPEGLIIGSQVLIGVTGVSVIELLERT